MLTIVKNSDVDHANAHIFRVSTETADTFRDLFGDRLQLQGFDENYNLTAEGAILEDLIDEFYCK